MGDEPPSGSYCDLAVIAAASPSQSRTVQSSVGWWERASLIGRVRVFLPVTAKARPKQARLARNAAIEGAWPPASVRSTFAPRPAPLGITFLMTLLWFMTTLRSWSPIDALPFAWTWLTLWLAASVGLELWRRYRQTTGLHCARIRDALRNAYSRISPAAQSAIVARGSYLRGHSLTWFRRPGPRR